MKTRESGTPEEEVWSAFFTPEEAGFRLHGPAPIDPPPYHYGMVMARP